jgi:hypothetical protein
MSYVEPKRILITITDMDTGRIIDTMQVHEYLPITVQVIEGAEHYYAMGVEDAEYIKDARVIYD